MQKFQEIVFIQGEEAEEPLNILDSEGESAALQYLAQWDYGENDGEICASPLSWTTFIQRLV